MLATLCTQVFGGHYQQQGNINEEVSSFKVKDSRLASILEMPNPYYEFKSDRNTLAKEDNAYKKANCNEYVGASGRTHQISKIFETYQKRILSIGDRDFAVNANHDADVFVVVNKEGANYTIDIYTGADAAVQKKVLKK